MGVIVCLTGLIPDRILNHLHNNRRRIFALLLTASREYLAYRQRRGRFNLFNYATWGQLSVDIRLKYGKYSVV
jgi:hypothetical protein